MSVQTVSPATRAEGLRRVDAFTPSMGRVYAAKRNYDLGPDDRHNVSLLSPYIRHRLVLEEEAVRAALSQHSESAAEKFVQEVFWRTYWKGWLETRPSVWAEYEADLARALNALERDGALHGAYHDAVEGRTGIDCFDDWTRELTRTGYLHNHARMWFASIWIFTLRLPWVLGADYFYRHLLDGDPASNTLGWRWVAGLHTNGKTYAAREANIAKFTGERYRPRFQLSYDTMPLDDVQHPPAGAVPPARLTPPDGPYGLLLTEEDLCPETLGLAAGQCQGIAGLVCTAERSRLPIGAPVQAFARDAMDDALTRAQDHFGQRGTAHTDSEAIVDWAHSLDGAPVVTAYAPVGPVGAALIRLERAGVPIVRLRRLWDERAWPHATKGFFGLKKHIPKLIKAMDGLPL